MQMKKNNLNLSAKSDGRLLFQTEFFIESEWLPMITHQQIGEKTKQKTSFHSHDMKYKAAVQAKIPRPSWTRTPSSTFPVGSEALLNKPRI